MFGLDERIAEAAHGGGIGIVLLVAVLLGLRHATDPDHVAAVTTVLAGTRDRARLGAARLGLAWGAGHALTLFAFGLPILLFDAYLPDVAQRAVETAVALVIVALAVRLLVRWRRGLFHVHEHEHDGSRHVHVHVHEPGVGTTHAHAHGERTPLGAFGIGLLHGVGGSAGVGILIVAAVESTSLAIASLGVLALFTAVSMTALTTGFGLALGGGRSRGGLSAAAPVFGVAGLAFGVWYATAAWSLSPYPF